MKSASHNGFPVHFSTQLLAMDHHPAPGFKLCVVEDLVTSITYTIRARYVFSADGGRSSVAGLLDFKINTAPSMSVVCKILVNAGLGAIVHERHGQLHWIMKPDMKSRFGIAPVMRMVRPWEQWLLVRFYAGDERGSLPGLGAQIGGIA